MYWFCNGIGDDCEYCFRCNDVRWGGSWRVLWNLVDVDFENFFGFLGFFFYLKGIVFCFLIGDVVGDMYFLFFRNFVVDGVMKLILCNWFLLNEFYWEFFFFDVIFW